MDLGSKSNDSDEEPTATPMKGIEGIRSTTTSNPRPAAGAAGERAGVSGSKRKRRRKHYVYLVFDDWTYGYSIHKVNLSRRRNKQTAFSAPPDAACLPPALFRLEAPHGSPEYFASAFGTRILTMHTRDPGATDCWPGPSMTFCPGHEYPINPIYLSVGDTTLFCLSETSFEMLHWEPLCPPPLGQRRSREWSWQRLEHPPFKGYNVTSYAVHPEACTIFVSTKRDDDIAAATFAFDTAKHTWEQLGSWALPFSGRGHFDPHLNAFNSNTDTLGQVYSCCLPSSSTGHGLEWKLGKEKLFSQDPAERHVGATLVYMGHSKFCLVQCVSNSIEGESNGQELKEEEGDVGGPVCRTEDWGADPELDEEADVQELKEEGDVQELKEKGDEDEVYDQELMDEVYDQKLMEERYVPGCSLYHLTTFSLSYDINGDLLPERGPMPTAISMPTAPVGLAGLCRQPYPGHRHRESGSDLMTGNTCRLLYYKVPDAITRAYLVEDPVAFCM
ncbi:hypothetical protein VPH35_130452 [Triticum aestivum]